MPIADAAEVAEKKAEVNVNDNELEVLIEDDENLQNIDIEEHGENELNIACKIILQ